MVNAMVFGSWRGLRKSATFHWLQFQNWTSNAFTNAIVWCPLLHFVLGCSLLWIVPNQFKMATAKKCSCWIKWICNLVVGQTYSCNRKNNDTAWINYAPFRQPQSYHFTIRTKADSITLSYMFLTSMETNWTINPGNQMENTRRNSTTWAYGPGNSA